MLNIFKNLPLKIFSLFLAAVLWVIIIASQQTPYQFTEELDIKPFNMAEQFSIVTSLPRVKIKIIASKEILPKLTKQDFEAYIDLKDITTGKHTLNVSVAPKAPNVTVASIQPAQATVDIEKVAQKQAPVYTMFKGSPAQDHKIERITPHTNKVQIKGAESIIKKINEVTATVYFDGTEDSNFQKEIILQAFDQSGTEIKEITIEPKNIKADIVISATMQQKSVGIKTTLKGSPKNGRVESVQIDPSAIDIKGDKTVLESIDYIETVPIDISDASEKIEKFVPLNMPKGASLVNENKDRVKVIIEIKPL